MRRLLAAAMLLAFATSAGADETEPPEWVKALRLRGLGHLGQGDEDLFLGEINVFQGVVKKLTQCLFSRHRRLLGIAPPRSGNCFWDQ